MIRTKSWCEAGLRTIGWIVVRLRAHPGRTADALRKDGCEDPGGDRCGGPAGRFAPARLRQSVAGPCRTCLALLSALGPRLQHRRRPAGPAETLRLARSRDFRRDNAVLSLRHGSAASHLLLRGSYDPDRDRRIEGSIQAICRQGRRGPRVVRRDGDAAGRAQSWVNRLSSRGPWRTSYDGQPRICGRRPAHTPCVIAGCLEFRASHAS